MAKKLSSVFFSAIKRTGRMQRQALKLLSAPAFPPRKKQVAKKTARSPTPARAQSSAKPKAAVVPAGKGVWQDHVHDTIATSTELLGRLAYSLYRPGQRPIAGLPLVIMLHGCQQTPQEMAEGTRMNRLADSKGFVVAYPQQARRVQSMRCWRWFKPQDGFGLAEADAIADLARVLVRRYKLDASRVYIAGLSAGAGMAALAALRHPRLFAAVALHSGVVVGAARDTASGLRTMRSGSERDPIELVRPFLGTGSEGVEMPALIVHGDKDRAVATRNAVQLAEQFSWVNGASVRRESVMGEATHRQYVRNDFLKDGRVVVRLCLLREVGHAWSGGDPRLKFHSEKGPSASLLMWQFFQKHERLAEPYRLSVVST